MKRGSIGMAISTGIFVGVVVFIFTYLVPEASSITSFVIAVLAAFIGGLIGNKLEEQTR